jgi:restriction system protein
MVTMNAKVAQISQQRTGVLMQTLFRLLEKAPDGLKASEAMARLIAAVEMTPYEAGEYESGGRRFEKIVRFATVDSVKAGWMIKHKGVWSVTEAGLEALRQYPDPGVFQREAVKRYNAWRKAQPDHREVESPVDEIEESAAITLEEAEEHASHEIEQYLAAMPPYEFQTLVGELLAAMGYHVGWEAPPGKDGGVDLVAFTDPLGTRAPRIKVQVKRNAQSSRIDVIGLRSFMAVLGEDDVGIFVALSGFTRDAEQEARQTHRRLTLIDMARFIELWTSHHEKLSDAARRRLPLKPVWFLAGEG